ncbi:amino acid transporter [Gonapodya prolifera JEL478]|uniref:Amino acid transporter n=1 Tax=Gonapodya prolifera (strain JEL478) TaxID=1344416 RepID=A0A139A8R8_GONPJ|nr:amino acid transporter [Gonapodya prolifera JEL478]|eukprot:KXS12783.1 amino acid transporter [Gonapodya prolifera JEL478]
MSGAAMDKDAIALAKLGYNQSFSRALGAFENFAASFSTIAFTVGLPQLFGYAMLTGGPLAAWINWIIVGCLALSTSLCLAEICSAMPTAGSIYFWSAKLGGDKHGPFLAWLTAWWNFFGWVVTSPAVQQGGTLMVVSALKIANPDVNIQPYHQFLLTTAGLLYGTLLNVSNEHVLKWFYRISSVLVLVLYLLFMIWVPAKAPAFQSREFLTTFINNTGFSDSYTWMIGLLFPAWTFYGYDASAHVAEETTNASRTAARGMWGAVAMSFFFSFPLLIVLIFCVQNIDDIIAYQYPVPIASLLVHVRASHETWVHVVLPFPRQNLGDRGAIAVLTVMFIVTTNCTAACMMSGSRIAYAISRDDVLPGSRIFHHVGANKLPNRAVIMMTVLGVLVSLPILGSSVAFQALASTATVAIDTSYAIPIFGRIFIAGESFKKGEWNLGAAGKPLGTLVITWISILFVCLCLPQLYPVDANNLNYCPALIGAITLISIFSWVLSGRNWYKGPQRLVTVEEAEALEREFAEKHESVGVEKA